ncbi:hypothetical protein CBM2589_B10083 [Cupriavidus taiwanensis]|uniref:Uncharacterized protein n=1 Tax=Cupriavidus taiwanensis TaxID=164546 RepID=A0A375B802_9BURK|nr:hypothetical protein CBM2589_B10083 [Cupriavidus taiwanensis]
MAPRQASTASRPPAPAGPCRRSPRTSISRTCCSISRSEPGGSGSGPEGGIALFRFFLWAIGLAASPPRGYRIARFPARLPVLRLGRPRHASTHRGEGRNHACRNHVCRNLRGRVQSAIEGAIDQAIAQGRHAGRAGARRHRRLEFRAVARQLLSGEIAAVARAGLRQPPPERDRNQQHLSRHAEAHLLCEVARRDPR